MQSLRATEDASVNRFVPAVTLGCTQAWGRSCTSLELLNTPGRPQERIHRTLEDRMSIMSLPRIQKVGEALTPAALQKPRENMKKRSGEL